MPVLIALINIAALLTLLIFRSLDDNRLTSWYWVFVDFSPLKFFFMLALGMLIAYVVSRISLTGRAPICWLAAVSFLISVFFWRVPEVIPDAARYFMQSKYVDIYGPGYFLREWGKAIPAWTDMPLVPFIFGVIFRVFGDSKTVVQVFTSLLFSGTVVLTWLIGKSLWNERIGLNAGALLLGIPYLFTQVPLFMVDVATLFFLTLAIFAIINAVKTGYLSHGLFAATAITMALLAKYSNWMVLAVIPFVVLANHQQGLRVLARNLAIIAVGVVVLMGAFLLIYHEVIVEQLKLLQSYQLPALDRWTESHVSTFLFQVHPLISVASLFSLYRAAVKKDCRFLIICSLVILVLVVDVKRIRYLMVIFPMLALMSAYGLESLKNVAVRKFAVSCTAVSAISIAAFAYLPYLEKTSAINIKRAGEFLDSTSAENVAVYVLSQSETSINPSVAVPILDLYTCRDLNIQTFGGSQDVRRTIDRLPLRWTWEIDRQHYSRKQLGVGNDQDTIVVIYGALNQTIPADLADQLVYYQQEKEFSVSDSAFKFQTLIRIFQRNPSNAGEESS